MKEKDLQFYDDLFKKFFEKNNNTFQLRFFEFDDITKKIIYQGTRFSNCETVQEKTSVSAAFMLLDVIGQQNDKITTFIDILNREDINLFKDEIYKLFFKLTNELELANEFTNIIFTEKTTNIIQKNIKYAREILLSKDENKNGFYHNLLKKDEMAIACVEIGNIVSKTKNINGKWKK